MPEGYDKYGKPSLFAISRCLVQDCGKVTPLSEDQAARIARLMVEGVSIRYFLGKLRCSKCGHHNAALEFRLMYRGPQPWTKSTFMGSPWTKEPAKTK
jgi:hypothetical protein